MADNRVSRNDKKVSIEGLPDTRKAVECFLGAALLLTLIAIFIISKLPLDMLIAQMSEIIWFCVILGIFALLSVITGFGYLRRARKKALKCEIQKSYNPMALHKRVMLQNLESRQKRKFRIYHKKTCGVRDPKKKESQNK